MKKHEADFDVSRMCHVLGVSRSGFYSWKKRPESQRKLENKKLLFLIKQIFEKSKSRYGSPKILCELLKAGYKYGHNRIARIMRENKIMSKVHKKFRPSGSTIRATEAAPNLLNRQFNQEIINKAWATDITYIRTKTGWAYLCVFMDLCSKMITGWAVSNRMDTELVLKALRKAYISRRPGKNLIIHSDQGSQFGSNAFQSYLNTHGFVQSMSRRGNCWDNACVENFFRLIKIEELNDCIFKNVAEVEYKVFCYIEAFYNRKRSHSQLGYISPAEYEAREFA